mgnify:CR=1 FL=1
MSGCPRHHPITIPTDGTPLAPSPTLAELREDSAAVPLLYEDGTTGWLVTRYDLARSVLEDPRFSQLPQRMPAGDGSVAELDVDSDARAARQAGNLLALDGDQHSKIRRAITSRFSVRAVRAEREAVTAIVSQQLTSMLALGNRADLLADYAEPISAAVHRHVLGIPEDLASEFDRIFVHGAPDQDAFDFTRTVLSRAETEPGDDVLGDLVRSALSPAEREGVAHVLMTSGRDSVAYLIVTSVVALLGHPDQLGRLRADPSLLAPALEEFQRFGTMFVSLFPRTALEDVQLEGMIVRAGESVSVSPVAANRDPRRFSYPDILDTARDSFGHLGFGHGIHGCVGQQLARLEVTEALTQLLSALPSLALVSAEQLRPGAFAHPVPIYAAGSAIVSW